MRVDIVSVCLGALLMGAGLTLLNWSKSEVGGGNQPSLDSALATYATELQELYSATQRDAPIDRLLAIPCPSGNCILVRAGGRDFLINAGQGADESLLELGALSPKLDAVLLTELDRVNIDGLAAVRDRSLEQGRKSPLPVFGPAGVESVGTAINAMLEASDAERALKFGNGLLPFKEAPIRAQRIAPDIEGQTVFDSGVVRITAYPSTTEGGQDALAYRIDYEDGSLIISGCGMNSDSLDGLSQTLDAQTWAWISPVRSQDLLEKRSEIALRFRMDREARFMLENSRGCPEFEDALAMANQLGADWFMAAPLNPQPEGVLGVGLWNTFLEGRVDEPPDVSIAPIGEGVSIPITGMAQAPDRP